MKKYRLSFQAEQDLLDILITGIENWGERQAQRYAEQLHDCFNLLAEFPEMGQERAKLQGCPRSFTKGSHIIFYRKINLMIEISTVLHQRMDIESQLV